MENYLGGKLSLNRRERCSALSPLASVPLLLSGILRDSAEGLPSMVIIYTILTRHIDLHTHLNPHEDVMRLKAAFILSFFFAFKYMLCYQRSDSFSRLRIDNSHSSLFW